MRDAWGVALTSRVISDAAGPPPPLPSPFDGSNASASGASGRKRPFGFFFGAPGEGGTDSDGEGDGGAAWYKPTLVAAVPSSAAAARTVVVSSCGVNQWKEAAAVYNSSWIAPAFSTECGGPASEDALLTGQQSNKRRSVGVNPSSSAFAITASSSLVAEAPDPVAASAGCLPGNTTLSSGFTLGRTVPEASRASPLTRRPLASGSGPSSRAAGVQVAEVEKQSA